MNSNKRTAEFLARLKDVANTMPHDELADFLDVKTPLLRNWLYRDKPSRFAVRLLKPRLDAKWRTIKVRLQR